jgi:hypothetical protein
MSAALFGTWSGSEHCGRHTPAGTMQPHHQINHTNVFDCFNIVTLATSYSMLPDDGAYTETCWSCLSVNFHNPFKAVLLFIIW